MALRFAKKNHTPWLHIEHGSDFVSLSNPITNRLARLYDFTFGRLVLKSANELVANSQASARFVKKLANRQAQVIYRGVDKEIIASTPPDQAIKQAHHGKVVITFVGRLIDGKGVDDLLKAQKEIAPGMLGKHRVLTQKNTVLKRRAYHCLIIGSGPQENNLKRLTKQLKLTDHVTFLGQRSEDEVIAILKASDIFINPSHTEGLPTSVIEAALCQIAIIATSVGGTPEIITDQKSGYLIPLKQPKILAQKLRQLINNPTLRQQLAQNAYQEVQRKFSWDQAVEDYKLLFSRLLT